MKTTAAQTSAAVADGGAMAFVTALFTGLVEAAPWTEIVAMVTVPYVLVRLAIAVLTFRDKWRARGSPS